MKTIKIKLEIPTVEDITKGLDDLASIHPALQKAEASAQKAQADLKEKREHLQRHENIVASLPENIRRGQEPTSSLLDAMRERDASALLIEPCEVALARAEEKRAAEQANAEAKRQKVIEKRTSDVAAIAAQLAPVCEILGDLDFALAQQEDRSFRCTGKISWPTCPEAELAAENRAFGMAENERARASAPKRY